MLWSKCRHPSLHEQHCMSSRHSKMFPAFITPPLLATPLVGPSPGTTSSFRPTFFIHEQPLQPKLVPHCHHIHLRFAITSKSSSNNNSAEPPQVKASFYKNPSKAIEKGGGFFIPGLRGPRLRFFVSFVSISLLSLNHFLSPSVPSDTLAISESIALFSTFCVFATAITDTFLEVTSIPQKSITSTTSTELTQKLSTPLQAQTQQQQSSPQSHSWALEACQDLTSITHIVVFHKGQIILTTDNIKQFSSAQSCGQVVQRVQQEQRALYIADTADLPPDVTLPFLQSDSSTPVSWAAFVVSIADEFVVVFGKAKLVEGGGGDADGLSMVDRRWLEAFAPRLVSKPLAKI